MWEVEVTQLHYLKYVEKEVASSISGKFDSIEDAKAFATLLLKGFPKSTAIITYEESNFKKEEETKE